MLLLADKAGLPSMKVCVAMYHSQLSGHQKGFTTAPVEVQSKLYLHLISCQRRQQDLASRSLIIRKEAQQAQTPASGRSYPSALTLGGCSAWKDDCAQVGL